MKREAFKMFLKPGFEKEYEKRHAAIWPELKKMLSDGEYMITPFIGTRIQIFCLLVRKLKERSLRKIWEPILSCRMVGLYGGYHGSESG